jgi:hypothetical protein
MYTRLHYLPVPLRKHACKVKVGTTGAKVTLYRAAEQLQRKRQVLRNSH